MCRAKKKKNYGFLNFLVLGPMGPKWAQIGPPKFKIKIFKKLKVGTCRGKQTKNNGFINFYPSDTWVPQGPK